VIEAVEVVLPCLDEADALPGVLAALPAGCPALVVDNGSAAASMPVARPFDAALAGAATGLELADGRHVALPVDRWHAAAAGADHWMLQRCDGPTVDLGCGPGRLVAALLAAGVPALGVDHSHHAIRLCRARGAPTAWFPWASVGLAAAPDLARAVGLRVTASLRSGERGVVQLVGDGHG